METLVKLNEVFGLNLSPERLEMNPDNFWAIVKTIIGDFGGNFAYQDEKIMYELGFTGFSKLCVCPHSGYITLPCGRSMHLENEAQELKTELEKLSNFIATYKHVAEKRLALYMKIPYRNPLEDWDNEDILNVDWVNNPYSTERCKIIMNNPIPQYF
jgi:hypothetical protein